MDIDPKEYAERNWDGYGAEPIPLSTIEFAKSLDVLFSKPPEWSPCPDGTISFEWVDFENDRKVFVDVGPDYVSIYARVSELALHQRKSVADIKQTPGSNNA